MESSTWTSIDPDGGLLPFWCHPENHDMRLVAMLEEENVVTSPFVLLSEEETLLPVKHSSTLAGINVKTTESGEHFGVTKMSKSGDCEHPDKPLTSRRDQV